MADIKQLQPKLQRMCNAFVSECKKKGIDVAITQTLRTIEYQNKLYAQGRTTPGRIVTNCKGGDSFHNWGVAFDFVILEKGRPDWNTRNKKWGLAGAIGEKIGLTWGGRWTKFVDLPHLEYTAGYGIQDFKKKKVDYKKFA